MPGGSRAIQCLRESKEYVAQLQNVNRILNLSPRQHCISHTEIIPVYFNIVYNIPICYFNKLKSHTE